VDSASESRVALHSHMDELEACLGFHPSAGIDIFVTSNGGRPSISHSFDVLALMTGKMSCSRREMGNKILHLGERNARAKNRHDSSRGKLFAILNTLYDPKRK